MSMHPSARIPRINVTSLIDESKTGVFQVTVLILCGLSVIIDGSDFQMIGFVAPSILKEWGGDKASLGPVFAAGILGLVLGSFVFGVLADKIGRRPVLIFSTAFVALCMIATVFTTSMNALMVVRFVTGIGLGSIMPNAMALAAEFSPTQKRLTLTTVVSTCFALGAVLSGFLCAAMIPHWGWRSVFYAGSLAPAVTAVLMFVLLPESIQYLVLRGKTPAAARLLTKITGASTSTTQSDFVLNESATKPASVAELFRNGRATTTILLWMVNFLNLLNLMFLSSWIPTIVVGDGFPTSTGVLAGTTLQVGGVIGALLMGQLIESVGFRRVLIPCFVIAAVALVFVGRPGLSIALLFSVVTLSGFCVVGSQQTLNGMAASYYPTALRSTGAGCALGAGRLGSIIGPLIGGVLIGMKLPMSTIFIIVALPAIACAAMIWALNQDGWRISCASRRANNLELEERADQVRATKGAAI